MKKLSDALRERGYAYQYSAERLEEVVDGPKRTLYLGVDPTADSMHVGQLMGMLVLRRFIEDGHKLILLIGDGTGMIGDPGGKSAERNLLDPDVVIRNGNALKAQFERLLGDVKIETMVRNSDWLSKLNYMEFLRDIGKHFTVNEMIKRDSVRPRLETPDQSISYTEFSYMLLQAYDFLHLNREHGCDLQVGGSDQWGNIVSGVDLIRRVEQRQAYALSWPLLIDKKSGKKFGKSEGNAVWLDSAKTSPFQFYQFWFNQDDDMLEELLKKMTMLEEDEITSLMRSHTADPGMRTGQQRLAREVTTLVHGESASNDAESLSQALFGEFSESTLPALAQLSMEGSGLEFNVSIGEDLSDIMVASGLASSKREARQFMQDGGVSLNNSKELESRPLHPGDLVDAVALLKRGKRNVRVLKMNS